MFFKGTCILHIWYCGRMLEYGLLGRKYIRCNWNLNTLCMYSGNFMINLKLNNHSKKGHYIIHKTKSNSCIIFQAYKIQLGMCYIRNIEIHHKSSIYLCIADTDYIHQNRRSYFCIFYKFYHLSTLCMSYYIKGTM